MSTPEQKIQNEIGAYLQKKGAFFFRVNNGAVFDKKLNNGRGAYRSPSRFSMNGISDFVIIDAYGGFVGCEIKSKRGKLSADQILFKKRCERHNALYIVATCVEDVENANIQFK